MKPRFLKRRGDNIRRKRLAKYVQLLQVGPVIASELNFDRLFRIIIEQICRVVDAELRANAMAREKAIDHLSHELKTPLAVISAALERIDAKCRDNGMSEV